MNVMLAGSAKPGPVRTALLPELQVPVITVALCIASYMMSPNWSWAEVVRASDARTTVRSPVRIMIGVLWTFKSGNSYETR